MDDVTVNMLKLQWPMWFSDRYTLLLLVKIMVEHH